MKIRKKTEEYLPIEESKLTPEKVEEYMKKCGVDIEKFDKEAIEYADRLEVKKRILEGRIRQLEYEEMRKGEEINTKEVYGIVNMEGNIAYSFRKEGSNSEEEKKMEKKYIEKDLKELEQLKKIEI
jgi:hypothetical protein